MIQIDFREIYIRKRDISVIIREMIREENNIFIAI